MADITKCMGDNCPFKETCYRFKAVSNEYQQAYFIVPPYKRDPETDKVECEHYWNEKER